MYLDHVTFQVSEGTEDFLAVNTGKTRSGSALIRRFQRFARLATQSARVCSLEVLVQEKFYVESLLTKRTFELFLMRRQMLRDLGFGRERHRAQEASDSLLGRWFPGVDRVQLHVKEELCPVQESTRALQALVNRLDL